MSTTPAGTPARPPAWRPLEAAQRRVLGVLVEKAKTTPGGYPMSVNAIVAGCNQRNNRDPITAYDEGDVVRALDQLREIGVVQEIDWLGRVPKYKHTAYEWLGVDKTEMAVMAELLLRGPQTLGDLRGRASRMEPIADLAALRPVVDALVARGLMLELTPPGRGQLVSHALYLGPEREALQARAADEGVVRVVAGETPPPPPRPGQAADLDALRAEIAELRERVARLEARLEGEGA